VSPVTPDRAAVSVHADTEVHADESRLDDNKTTSEQVSAEHTVDTSTTVVFTSGVSHATPSSSLEKNDLRRLLGDVDKFFQTQEPETFALILRGDLRTVDGRIIYMFVDVSYPLSEATLERTLWHGLEVPMLLVGGDLTMAEQLVSFINAALLIAHSAI
nr:hypothetical protein [Tanacetum cinerariifolium]